MKQKTAMQLMLDALSAHEWEIPIELVIKCMELIELEKEGIIMAHTDGFLKSKEGWNGEFGLNYCLDSLDEIGSEKYYNEKYE
jgi:hypothetical protein